jgi:beta-glucanase (GH16 family)
MSFRSSAFQRFAVSLVAVLMASACTEGSRPVPGSKVEAVPPGPSETVINHNITNPTLSVPVTFKVSPGDALTLVWSDEFDGATLDPEVWFFESGDGSQYGFGQNGVTPGWGNNELQYYLPDSAELANGILSITARREVVEGYNHTSARINTQDRFAVKYGRIEARIKLPAGKGLWPAFWMLPQDTDYGNWAASGEIDIVEAINLDGSGSDEIHGTIHFGGEEPANRSAGTNYVPSADITTEFHTYAVEWDASEIRWYFDGMLYGMQNAWNSTAAPFPAPFDQPFHILLNVAVGGNWPGSPDGTTVFPAVMEVDYVRVYSGEDSVDPADPGTIPDDVIYASDPNETVDIVFGVDYADFTPFDSGSTFDGVYAGDADFSPAFAVTTGNGYGAQVGQLALVGFNAGFASGYGTLDFKAQGLNNDLIRIKVLDAGQYLAIT